MKPIFGVIKSYKKGNIELLVTQSHVGLYNFTKIVENDFNKSIFQSHLEPEDALDCFDYWMEENEAPKEKELSLHEMISDIKKKIRRKK